MQQFDTLLPTELTNEEIRNSNAYKEYYEIAIGASPPKPKASVRRTRSSSDTSITPPTTAASPRLTTSAKSKQTAKASKAKSLSALSEDEESFDPIPQTLENSDDEGNGMESIFETTSQMDAQTPTSVPPLPMTAPTMTPSTIATITTTSQAPILPPIVSSNIIPNLPNFGSLFCFDDRLRSLEVNFSEAMQTNQFARAVSAILEIVQRYMDQRMNKAVKVAIQIQSDRLRDDAQRDNDEFLKTVDENMQKIIKEQVKEQVKTSYAVAADLSEMELKKILIEKMEGNKDDEMMMLIRMKNPPLDQTGGRRDAEKEKSPSQQALLRKLLPGALAGQHKGLNPDKRRQASLLLQRSLCRPPVRRKSPYIQSLTQKPLSLDRDWNKTVPAIHGRIQPWISELAKQTDSRSSFNELIDTPIDFSSYLINRLKFYGFAINWESARDVYSKRRIIAVTELKIVEWHNYKHLDWITVLRDDDKLYKFKEGDFKRLHIQDIEDMLMLLIQGKLTNLRVEECFAFNVSLRMFTRSIVIQRRMEDLQLGVESYQKKLNLTKQNSYRSDLKRKEAYTAYSNLRGFNYQNKDNKNRLMRIDELHKFNDGTLTDVRTALDDHLKGIRMQYLPQSI
uniref:Uncharacterized protein n=1 Tax=Tanacetum cinerariifolium TaxID=118510 RepID=A0A6L2KKI2_TANCI|nr:hypothetical protein [Tanacetum cinerariifolium]